MVSTVRSASARPTVDGSRETKLRVTVLRGGPGAERAVSLESGRAVAEALRRLGHHVHESDVSPDDLAALDRPADVVFPVLHGTFGEDGALQRVLERRGLRFVGSGALASALAIDKVRTKQVVLGLGLDTPDFDVVDADAAPRGPSLLPPVVVKPVDQGSSVMTSIVREAKELSPAIRRVVDAYGRALVERFVPGDELTVGIVGAQALPPICIRPKRGFYDYEAKYHDDRTEYLFEAGHSQELLGRVASQTRRVFDALGCRHLARVDWIVDADERAWFLEVNTMPGFTAHSLVPKAAARAGIPFDELCERLVRMAAAERCA